MEKSMVTKLFIVVLYISFTTIVFCQQTNVVNDIKSTRLFFLDEKRDERIADDILKDTDIQRIPETRLFHNKVTESIDIATDSLFQVLDPVFLFSLTEQKMHRASDKRTLLLHPIELVFFLIAFVYTARNWKSVKKTQKKVIIALFVSWIMIGVLSPVTLSMKYLPFLISLRLFIAVAVISIFSSRK